jgi:hypothetical protein
MRVIDIGADALFVIVDMVVYDCVAVRPTLRNFGKAIMDALPRLIIKQLGASGALLQKP